MSDKCYIDFLRVKVDAVKFCFNVQTDETDAHSTVMGALSFASGLAVWRRDHQTSFVGRAQ